MNQCPKMRRSGCEMDRRARTRGMEQTLRKPRRKVFFFQTYNRRSEICQRIVAAGQRDHLICQRQAKDVG